MTTFPGFEHFFRLSDPVLDRPFRGELPDEFDSLAVSRAEAQVSTPVRVSHAMGARRPSDLIWTTSGHPLIVSQRVVDLLTSQKVSGWSTYPVAVHTPFGVPPLPYFGLAISGRCGPIDLARSAITLRESPGGYYPYFVGHFFEPSSWDGSDFFMEEPDIQGRVSSVRLLSMRAALVFQRLRNATLCPLPSFTQGTAVFEVGSPYELPHDFHSRVRAAFTERGISIPSKYQG